MHPREIVAAYRRGENLMSLLKNRQSSEEVEACIEVAYDLQAGSYIDLMNDWAFAKQKHAYAAEIAQCIDSITDCTSLMEVGVGEATTLSVVMKQFHQTPRHVHGFDISWSRVARAREWLSQRGQSSVFLSVASLFHIPYVQSSFDVVYTSHSIEPNGGKESQILTELYRVASRYLVLLEPGYEFANAEQKQRMESHGYCRNLAGHAEDLGMRVIKHEPFPYVANPKNPTAVVVIEKDSSRDDATPQLACPGFGDLLTDHSDAFYSPESLRAYPKIGGIPCLRKHDGVVASDYERFCKPASPFRHAA
ncbi:MAG: class I SAM-dependent methyltransferase [Planctomycetota bacterium]